MILFQHLSLETLSLCRIAPTRYYVTDSVVFPLRVVLLIVFTFALAHPSSTNNCRRTKKTTPTVFANYSDGTSTRKQSARDVCHISQHFLRKLIVINQCRRGRGLRAIEDTATLPNCNNETIKLSITEQDVFIQFSQAHATESDQIQKQ